MTVLLNGSIDKPLIKNNTCDKNHFSRKTYVSYFRLIAVRFLGVTSFDQADPTGISYIDSSALAVCHLKRRRQHKVFKGIAQLGKSTKGWCMGLKLHLLIIAERHLTSSFILTSNRKIEALVDLFPDIAMGNAVMDRLGSHSYHLVLEGDSYRRQSGLIKGYTKEEKNIMP